MARSQRLADNITVGDRLFSQNEKRGPNRRCVEQVQDLAGAVLTGPSSNVKATRNGTGKGYANAHVRKPTLSGRAVQVWILRVKKGRTLCRRPGAALKAAVAP